MMAPAMSSRTDERLPYRDLAGQGARVTRSLPVEALPRLAAIAPGRSEVSVELAFALDDERRPWVSGCAEVTVAATCQRCLGEFEHGMRIDFALCIVSDAALASELAGGADVLVAEADAVTVAEVVEDELLLALPDRMCREEPCPHLPALSYPAPDASQPEPEDNPFHVLSVLKR